MPPSTPRPAPPTARGDPAERRPPPLAAAAAAPKTAGPARTVAPWEDPGPRTVEGAAAPAVWDPSGLPPVPRRWGRIRAPHGHFATQALLGPDPALAPAQLLAWFIQRWPLAVTFEAARRHLGLETPRPWSAAAIRRPTPGPPRGVLARHAAGPPAEAGLRRRCPSGHVVSPATPDLRRGDGQSSTRDRGVLD